MKPLKEVLKNSLDQERESVKTKTIMRHDERFERANEIFGNGKNLVQKNTASEVIRETFTMLVKDHAIIDLCRSRLLSKQHIITKSEVIRAGLALLNKISDAELLEIAKTIDKVKTGRKKQYKPFI